MTCKWWLQETAGNCRIWFSWVKRWVSRICLCPFLFFSPFHRYSPVSSLYFLSCLVFLPGLAVLYSPGFRFCPLCCFFPHFSALLCLTGSPPCYPFLPLDLHRRNLQKSTPFISQLSLLISLCIHPIHGSHRSSLWPLSEADQRVWASFVRQNKALLLLPLNQDFPFISGCLLAGCCLSEAAHGTLGAIHSWSFVLCDVSIIGGGFSKCPSPSGRWFSHLHLTSLHLISFFFPLKHWYLLHCESPYS